MMKKNLRWLESELQSWVSDGIINAGQADAIRKKYSVEEGGSSWGTIIFSSIGGVILGLGVILLFAYNWSAIPRYGKLAIVFAALAVTHAAALKLFLRSERFRALGEAFALLGTMFFGAGIWLVAQTYHIEEHFPNAFIIWAAGALGLAWAMPSVVQGVLAAVLVTIWCGCESVGFETPIHSGPLIILLLIGPLAYWKKSRVLLATVVPAFCAALFFIMQGLHHESGVMFGTGLNIAAFLVAAGLLAKRDPHFPEGSQVLLSYGWAASVIVMYILTFPDAAEHLLRFEHHKPLAWNSGYWIGSSVVCLGTWALVVRAQFFRKRDLGVALADLLLPLTVMMAIVYMVFKGGLRDWAVAGPFNLVFIALATTMMTRGCREGVLKPIVVGSILLMIYTVTRYFDLFHSLLVRGLVFIGAGALIFTQGIIYARTKKKAGDKKE